MAIQAELRKLGSNVTAVTSVLSLASQPRTLTVKSKCIKLAAMSAIALSLTACGHMGRGAHGPSAVSQLEARSGSSVAGTVKFKQHGDHVMATVEVSGLKPGQEHGFHVHDKGDCSGPDGMATGGHFNPTGKPHGPQSGDHHAGDMPGLKADANGRVSAQFHLTGVTLTDGPTSIVGRGVIVHKDPDDYKTQPTGNSGARIACGVVVKS
jgi:superoxide dismutase, Cu-Zn family